MLPQKLKDLRAVKGVSQANLADVLGVTQQAVAKWETEKAEPDSKTLKRIANYFSVSIDYLLDNESIKNTDEINMLNNYRSLNDNNKELFQRILCQLQLINHTEKRHNNDNEDNLNGINIMSPVVNGNKNKVFNGFA